VSEWKLKEASYDNEQLKLKAVFERDGETLLTYWRCSLMQPIITEIVKLDFAKLLTGK